MSLNERAELGLRGREHVQKNYNFQKLQASWRHLIESVHDKFGSWDTRKNYKNWELIEV